MYSVLLTALPAAALQNLNSIGALTFVHAFRYGRALVMSPLSLAAATLLAIGPDEAAAEPT